MGNHLATLSLREGSSWAFTVLEFAGWEERVALTSTNKHIRKQTNNDDLYWRFLCTLLAREHGVYVPPTVPKNLRTWRHLFRELFPMRKMWAPAPAPLIRDNDDDDDAFANVEVPMPEQGERNKIQVFARFKPKPEKKATDADDAAQAAEASESTDKDEVEVTLPLHQRLAMIRMSHNLTSNRQALKVLTTEGGWFTARWSEIAAKEKKQADNEDNINGGGGGGEDEKENAGASGSDGASPNKAAGDAATTKAKKAHVFDAQTDVDSSAAGRRSALPRDFAIRAGKGGDKITASVQSVDPGTGRVVMIAPDVGLREFAFDGVFPARASQQGVYDTVARGLVCDFLNGYNATCVVYGQTGSGKTYSMFGPDDAPPAAAAPTGHPSKGGDVNGIVPRACEEIFAAVKQRRDNYGILAEVGVSFVEVYGDTVSDLLRHGARCGHSKVAAQSFVLSGAAEHPVATMHDVSAALRTGAAQKRRAATAMNDRSSRAHSLFILTLKQHCVKTGTTRTSKLFLADLGGSEQVKRSQVDAGERRAGAAEAFSVGFEMGDRMREAVYINLGLLALKKCIEALNNQAAYVPYQDSKLTMLLSSGLGGNSKTAVLVACSSASADAGETVAALRFGERCALIETEARNNASMLAGVLAALDAQIAALEAEIQAKERWAVREEVRTDALAEAGTVEAAAGGMEVKKVTYLTGAENERRQLEKLLLRRADFTGQPLSTDPAEAPATAGAAGAAAGAGHDGGAKPWKKRAPRVVGFGKELAEVYGLGARFDEQQDAVEGNERFRDKVDADELPAVVLQKGGKQWRAGAAIEVDSKTLAARAKKVNRSRLMYAGMYVGTITEEKSKF